MLHFTKTLSIIALLFGLFSCARREQAFFQPSQREHFTQLTVHPPLSSANVRPSLDTNQVVVNPETDLIEASVQPNTIGNRPSPKWRNSPKVIPSSNLSSEKTTANQSVARPQKKARVYKSFLRRAFADGPVQTSGLAIASLICGILGFFVLGIVFGPLAIIFGGVALSKIRKNPEVKGRGLAVAGLILGIVATILILIILAAR